MMASKLCIIRRSALSLRAAASGRRCSFANCSRMALRASNSRATIASNALFPAMISRTRASKRPTEILPSWRPNGLNRPRIMFSTPSILQRIALRPTSGARSGCALSDLT